MKTLESVFGVQSSDVSAGSASNIWLKPVSEVLSTTDSYPHPELKINRILMNETLNPVSDGTRMLLTGGNGVATGTLRTCGKGQAIRLGFLPGTAFVHDAAYKKTYERGLPQEYRPELAEFISWPAVLAGVKPVGQLSSTSFLATLKRWDSNEGATPKRSVVFVIDYSGKPNPDFSMTLPDAAHFTKIRTAHGAKVTVTPAGQGQTRISFPLYAADAVIFE